jgi:hypothetical protein
MKALLYKQYLVFCIVLLFIGASVIPSITSCAPSYNVDNQSPTVDITNPIEDNWVRGNRTIIYGTAGDVDGWVVIVQVSFNSGKTWQDATGTNNWSYEWDTTVFPDSDAFKINARSKDNNDTFSEWDNVTVKIDNTKPVVTIEQPQERAVYLRNRYNRILSLIFPSDITIVIGTIDVQITAVDPDMDLQNPPEHGEKNINENVTFTLEWDSGKKTSQAEWSEAYNCWLGLWREVYFGGKTIYATVYDRAGNEAISIPYKVYYFGLGL